MIDELQTELKQSHRNREVYKDEIQQLRDSLDREKQNVNYVIKQAAQLQREEAARCARVEQEHEQAVAELVAGHQKKLDCLHEKHETKLCEKQTVLDILEIDRDILSRKLNHFQDM